jgi:hypothetical protein
VKSWSRLVAALGILVAARNEEAAWIAGQRLIRRGSLGSQLGLFELAGAAPPGVVGQLAEVGA